MYLFNFPDLVDECDRNSPCPEGEVCQIGSDAARVCVKDIAEGSECSFIKNCIRPEDCNSGISGEVKEKKCATGLFCRASSEPDCLVTGICVRITSAADGEANCGDDTRCHPDGDFICSITETTDSGDIMHTCYNPTNGEEVLTTDTLVDAEVDCRKSLDTCTSSSGKVVLSGERVDDPSDRCSYCICDEGRIDRTQCIRKMDCIAIPGNCVFNGQPVAHGETLTLSDGCKQKRCDNGEFIDPSLLDGDCDGREDVDVCMGQVDQSIVCAKTDTSIRARVPECLAKTAASYVAVDCDQDIDCSCQADELCIGNIRTLDLCVDAEGSGCKPYRCLSKSINISCLILATNKPVCSTNGVTYDSYCDALVNGDTMIKYVRACDDVVCLNDNNGAEFCGFDKRTYNNLCEVERITGNLLHDYDGTCETDVEVARVCEDIPVGCDFTTLASDAICPRPGGQGVVYIDTKEASEYAVRKGKIDLDLNDLVRTLESDWRVLTEFPLKDDKCEFTVRAKYDTIGALVVGYKAEKGEHCTTCGERLKLFTDKLRDIKGTLVAGSRRRRQTDESEYSGIFISPSDLGNDPLFHNGAYSVIASYLLILTSVVLAFIFS